MNRILTLVLLVSVSLISCDVYQQDEYEERYVIESYLVADNFLPKIRLSTTVEANQFYDFEVAAVNDAIVEVYLLESGPFSDIEEQFTYSVTSPGTYRPNNNHRVLPLRTYQVSITFDHTNDEITAYTTVPESFEILAGVQDSIIYQSSEQLQITLSESNYPGRQNIYVFNALSGNPVPENLTPFYAELFQDSDTPQEDLNLLANNSSGILNEGNFSPNPDGSITLSYPWVGIAFYEENKIVANTIDDNVYDFVRSQQVQLGGTTLSPGEIQNVIYHVEGGIGVFGSLASDTVSTYVKRGSF